VFRLSYVWLRLGLSLLSVIIGLKLYSTIRYVGILAIVIEPIISCILGIGCLFNYWSWTDPEYQVGVSLIVLLKTIGLYYIWKAVNAFMKTRKT